MTSPLVNRGFGLSLLVLLVATELFVRVAPDISPRLFRLVYGNILSMYMEVGKRLERSANRVQVLALGDSLAMTQFQPDIYEASSSLPAGSVFNAAYAGMSFPSQERLLKHIGMEQFVHLRRVLYFVNPHRYTVEPASKSDVFRIAIPDPDGPWRELWRTKRIAPVLDYSHLYALSRHLVFTAWRMVLRDEAVWDQVEYLQESGGVAFHGSRHDDSAPKYPYSTVDQLSEQRIGEMERVIRLFANRGIEVVLLPSAHHPSVNPFRSDAARERFDMKMNELAERWGTRYIADVASGFTPYHDRDFCDYGHVNRDGGIAFTRRLAQLPSVKSNRSG